MRHLYERFLRLNRSLKIALFFCPSTLRGGDVQGAGAGAGANQVGAIPFCAIENDGLHKMLQSFLKGHVFLCIPISILQKRNNKGGIDNTSNIGFFLSK